MDDDDEQPFLDGGDSIIKNKRKYSYLHTRRRSSKKSLFLILISICATCVLIFSYYNLYNTNSPPTKLSPTSPTSSVTTSSAPYSEMFKIPPNIVSFDMMQKEDFQFNINGSDVIVFLHIQKTGGTTFGRHLVQDIDLDIPCTCRNKKKKKKHRVKRKSLSCNCFRRPGSNKSWLFSRFSTGWKCGLHPDWTELVSCVDPYLRSVEGGSDRRYFYITFLREPVTRYLSEYRHVQRGATWKDARHACNGKGPTLSELPPCYHGQDWSDVSLKEFMACPYNLANNRLTRMLADLTLVHCYDTSVMSPEERDAILLNSAKFNLENVVSYFGLTEKQILSEYLFEETFNLKFKQKFVKFKRVQGKTTLHSLDDGTIEKIKKLNHLDIQLYEFAKDLMQKRFEELKDNDKEFDIHNKNLENKLTDEKLFVDDEDEGHLDGDDEYNDDEEEEDSIVTEESSFQQISDSRHFY